MVLHVTSQEEAQESGRQFSRAKAFTIANGVTIPNCINHVDRNGRLRLLYLGRLHPKKGIENLIIGFKLWKQESPTPSSLTIAGLGDDRYTASIKALINELDLTTQITIKNHVLGEAKDMLFANADMVVVPSHTENFGMVVAEALAHAVPVIASKGTPWKRIENIGCGLWVDNSPQSLANAIGELQQMPLEEMGQRGREWMCREFSWRRCAILMTTIYDYLINY